MVAGRKWFGGPANKLWVSNQPLLFAVPHTPPRLACRLPVSATCFLNAVGDVKTKLIMRERESELKTRGHTAGALLVISAVVKL